MRSSTSSLPATTWALVGTPGSSFFSGAAFANPGGGGFTLDLNGAEAAQGVLPFGQFATFAFTVQPGLPGDYNQDGVVDAADYTVWRDNLGQPEGTLPNDIDGGQIGPAQYATWQANFGSTGPGGHRARKRARARPDHCW